MLTSRLQKQGQHFRYLRAAEQQHISLYLEVTSSWCIRNVLSVLPQRHGTQLVINVYAIAWEMWHCFTWYLQQSKSGWLHWLQQPSPQAQRTHFQRQEETSVLLLLRSDPSTFISWWLPEETDHGQGNPLMKVAFQSGLDSKLLAGVKDVCFLHSKDKSHYQDTSSLNTNLRTSKSPYWHFIIFTPTGSFFFLELSQHMNRGLVTGIYTHTWAWRRTPKASWYHQLKSLTVIKKTHPTALR